MAAPRLLTLPELAQAIGVEYRTLHSWVGRGILRPSVQASRGAGVPNLFSTEDAVKAKVVADLRQTGVSFDMLKQTSQKLDDHPHALTDGAMVLVNGSVAIADAQGAAAAIQRDSLTLVYNTKYAVREIESVIASA
jgi:DNA-binding transcriptional MerR regulator